MTAVIRIRLCDLLRAIEVEPPARRQSTRPISPDTLADIEAIKEYLLAGPARRCDMHTDLGMTNERVLRRLNMLRERSEIVNLDGKYALARV